MVRFHTFLQSYRAYHAGRYHPRECRVWTCRRRPHDKMFWEALEEAQLADFVRELPEGLDITTGERGVRLSGGQRQRIGVARTLYTNPNVLEEAASAFDTEPEEAIMQSINALHGKKTMIIIAHRLTTIEGGWEDCEGAIVILLAILLKKKYKGEYCYGKKISDFCQLNL